VPDTPTPRHCVAVIGGACAGAEAVETLASRGVHCVVFEQNDRPYGKIEDGLPRWHDRQRRQEYAKLDGKVGRPGVDFVPRTRIGRDIPFPELARDWGFSAVLLANGSWRDRPAGVPGADENLGRGFAYQNPFIYWFNHHEEPGYSGPAQEIHEGAIVLGGGLASIDVVKVFMLESVAARLRARGIHADVVEMEHAGIPETLKEHGLTLEALGVAPATLVYRRSVREMPVASPRDGAGPEEKARVEGVREKLLAASTAKFLYRVAPHRVAKRVVAEGGRVTGVVLARTEYQGGKFVEVPGSEETVATRAVVSSVGSIPEPLEGVPMKGELYVYRNWDTGELDGYRGVFALGNVITGKGNIAVSRKHGKQIAEHVLAHYLGVGGEGRAEAMAGAAAAVAAANRERAEAVADAVAGRPALEPGAFDALRRRVAARQKAVGYADYASWIAAHGAG
jgi:ferredoxin--NADP+ reductase